jgi:hypothetical protein
MLGCDEKQEALGRNEKMMPVMAHVCASPLSWQWTGSSQNPRSSYIYVKCPLLVLISFVPITLTAAYVKRNVDPENHKAEHWGYHAPHRSWYFCPTHALRVAPPADQASFPPLDPYRDMEIESRGGRARRRDRTQEWLQTHRYGFRVWLVR